VTTFRTLVVLILVSAGTVFAQSPEQVFQQGNMLYQQGSLDEARKAYELLLGQGYVSGELYYNLGNVYYRTGNIARGILFYERAARLIPQDEDLQHNLTLANLRITDRIEPTPRLFIWDWWDGLKNALSLQGLTWLMFFSYLVVIAFVALLLLGGSYTVRLLGDRRPLSPGAGSVYRQARGSRGDRRSDSHDSCGHGEELSRPEELGRLRAPQWRQGPRDRPRQRVGEYPAGGWKAGVAGAELDRGDLACLRAHNVPGDPVEPRRSPMMQRASVETGNMRRARMPGSIRAGATDVRARILFRISARRGASSALASAPSPAHLHPTPYAASASHHPG